MLSSGEKIWEEKIELQCKSEPEALAFGADQGNFQGFRNSRGRHYGL